MNARQDLLDDLLDRWEVARERGEPLSIEALCQDHPELAEELRATIAALEWVPPIPGAPENSSITPRTPTTGFGAAEFWPRPPSRLGRYELHEPLGAGGCGRVWQAYDPELRRQVAVKVPHSPEGLARDRSQQFLEEARRVARLRHPSIASVYDVGHQDGWIYFVAELIHGINLRERLRAGRLPTAEACRIAAELAAALHHAHQQGVLHRDVKPGNVLLDQSGHAILTDFGIASDAENGSLPTDVPTGTLAYMSPEQTRGEALDARSDQFSLGVVLYEMLTCRLPWSGNEPAGVAGVSGASRRATPLTFPTDVPPTVRQVCERLLAESPDERFADCGQVADAMRHIANPVRDAYGSTPPKTGGPWKTAGIYGVLLIVAVLASIAIWQRLQGNASPSTADTVRRAVAAPQATASPPQSPANPPDASAPFRWYRFDNPARRWFTVGSEGAEPPLPIRGKPEITLGDDADAPPPELGAGVRFTDGATSEALLPDKIWLSNARWTISLWFNRRTVANDDFLVHLGESSGKGGGGCPQFSVWLTPEGDLKILNQKSFRSSDVDFDSVIPSVQAGVWHHLALVLDSPTGPAQLAPGRLRVYLDGREVAQCPQIYLGLSARNSKSGLAIGSVWRPGPAVDRTFHGVLADLRFYHRALADDQVEELWQEVPK